MKKIDIFSQPDQPIGNWISQFVKLFLGVATRALCLILIDSYSSRLGIMHRFFFFFWIPYSIRNFLEEFENFSHPTQPIGNQLSQFIGFFMGSLIST